MATEITRQLEKQRDFTKGQTQRMKEAMGDETAVVFPARLRRETCSTITARYATALHCTTHVAVRNAVQLSTAVAKRKEGTQTSPASEPNYNKYSGHQRSIIVSIASFYCLFGNLLLPTKLHLPCPQRFLEEGMAST